MRYPTTSELEAALFAKLEASTAGNARAMTATIVGVSDAPEAQALDDVISTLMGRRPVRVLHLRSDSSEDHRSWASARCSMDRQSRGVCFEDIYIESPDDSALESRVWGPLVIRELPALLLWTLDLRLLSGCGYDCAQRTDLTIIDGSRACAARHLDPRSCAEILRSAAEGEASAASGGNAGADAALQGIVLADLAWERLLPLRWAFSRLFDGPYAADLEGIEDLRIEGLDPWAAELFSAWVKDRLAILGSKSLGGQNAIRIYSLDREQVAPGSRTTGPRITGPRITGSAPIASDPIGPDSGKAASLRGGAEPWGCGKPWEGSLECGLSRGRTCSVRSVGQFQGRLTFSDGRTLDLVFPENGLGTILERLVDAPVGDPLYMRALGAI